MMLNFNTMQETNIPNFKGGEKEAAFMMFLDDKNRIMRGRLEPGASIGLHKHETNSEIIFVISGTGTVLYNGDKETISADMCHYCPKGHTHSLINTGTEDLIFYAVVPEQ